jgi:leucyl/phenylalanyl-tRNA---protein transferase
MIPFLPPGARFPPVERARRRPDGLLAAGADLSVDTLVRAYTHGIFPWFNEGDPILWWSPNPRMVLPCADFHLSRSLRRRLKRHDVCVSFDRAFAEMLAACAAPRDDEGGTWLVPDMQAAYQEMHERGFAHSVEVWRGERLLGGLYGVALGKMFFGESMVSIETDASKIALAWLAAQMLEWGMPIIDCQMATPHLESLGGRGVPRRQFTGWVDVLVRQPGPAFWRFEPGLDPAARLSLASTGTSTD